MKFLFIFLLILRSALDIFSDVSFGPLKLNIPALWGIFLICVGCLYFVFHSKVLLPKISKFFGVWIIMLFISTVVSFSNFSEQALISVRELIRIVTILMSFLIFYNLVKTKQDERLIKYFLFALPIPLVVGIYQKVSYSGLKDPHLNITRIYGSFAHPNSFALFLVFFILLTIWFIQNYKRKLLWYILLFLELFCLIFTFSFSGYILLLVSFIGLFLKIRIKSSKKNFFFLILFVLILFVIQTKEFKTRYERIKLIDLSETLRERKVVDSFTWRIVNWMNLFDLWKEKPILGWGLQTVEIINPWKTEKGVGYAAHNDFLRLLVETGLVGFMFYLLFLISTCFIVYREYKGCKEKHLKSLLYVLFVFFVSWQIVSGVGNYITVTAYQIYFWSLLGITLKLNKLLKRKNEDSYSISN